MLQLARARKSFCQAGIWNTVRTWTHTLDITLKTKLKWSFSSHKWLLHAQCVCLYVSRRALIYWLLANQSDRGRTKATFRKGGSFCPIVESWSLTESTLDTESRDFLHCKNTIILLGQFTYYHACFNKQVFQRLSPKRGFFTLSRPWRRCRTCRLHSFVYWQASLRT